MNSKAMDKQLNICHGIVIQNLPENLKREAVESLEATFFISASSVVSLSTNKFGVNLVFDGYTPFYKAITKRVLVVNCMEYQIYPMVTDLTVIGAGQFLNEITLKSFMSNIAPVMSVYLVKDQKGLLHDYRVIMNHPEIYEYIKLWPMIYCQIPGINTAFPITFFCRLCRQNGHTRHQCQQISCSDEKINKLKFQENRTLSHEDLKHSPNQATDRKRNVRVESYEGILRVPFHCDESIESKQKDGSLPPNEVKVSQPTLTKEEISETKHFKLQRDVESHEKILRVPFRCDESIESKPKDRSLPPNEVQVSHPKLNKIKIEKSETKLFQVKHEDADHPKQPEIKPCNSSTFTNKTKVDIPSHIIKTNSPRPKDSKTPVPQSNIDSAKKVPSKCKKLKKNQKVRFYKLIPPELHMIESPLKELFLHGIIGNETFSETIYTKAKLYPYGINILLHHLYSVVQFNLNEWSTKTCPERRFILWVDGMLTKIKEEHYKNNPEEESRCSSSDSKLECYSITRDESYLSKCNKVTDDLKNGKFKKECSKGGMEYKDTREHMKAQMNQHKKFQNKETLNASQKRNDKSLKNIEKIRQDVNLESVIKDITLNIKKNEIHCSSESFLNKKIHANQTEKVNVQRNKKHIDIKDASCDGIQLTNMDLQRNEQRRTINEVCNKKSVPCPKAKIDVRSPKFWAIKKVSVEKINRYTTINTDEKNDKIRCSVKEVCVKKDVPYPGVKMNIQKRKSCVVKRVGDEKILTSAINMDPAINMDEKKEKIRCSTEEVYVKKGVPSPIVKMNIHKQKKYVVKRVGDKKVPTYPAINMDEKKEKIRCSTEEVCIEKDVTYPGVIINMQNQKNFNSKTVLDEDNNTYPSNKMQILKDEISYLKKVGGEKSLPCPGVKTNIQKQKSCIVKRVGDEKISTSAINMDEKNDKIRCSMEEVYVKKGVPYPGVITNKQNQKSFTVKRVLDEDTNTYPSVNVDVHKNKTRCIKEGQREKSVSYAGAKMDVQQKETHCPFTGVKDEINIFNTTKMDVHKDKKEVLFAQMNLYQATKMNVQKGCLSAKSPKTGQKKQTNKGKLCAKWSPGLLYAVRCSKGILKPSNLKAFLIHVKGKVHVRQMAKHYSPEVNQIVTQLETIVNKHFCGLKANAPTSKEIAWIKELAGRLKAHENCETCQK